MKTSVAVCALLSLASVQAFAPAIRPSSSAIVTHRYMFSGSGTGAAEDDSATRDEMEKAAKAMGMSIEEYELGIKARNRLENDLNTQRHTGGIAGITVERDAKNPPTHLVVTITEDGKAKGREAVQTALVEAAKQAGDLAKKGRTEAQRNMMAFIQQQMK